MKIGLFFGTFNPVHLGHIGIVTSILNKNIFDQLWIVLTPRSPHKNFNLTPKENRLEMLNIAFKNYQKVLISDVEFNLKEPNYTIDTLTYLSVKFPEHDFSIIIGSDNFLKIKTWKEANKIIEKYSIYVYPRAGFDCIINVNYKSIYRLRFPEIKISSTLIRNKISLKEKGLEDYLPLGVLKYIKEKQLY